MADGPSRQTDIGIRLYWIPLGAGGSGFVRLNGRIYEAFKARMADPPVLDLLLDFGGLHARTRLPSPTDALVTGFHPHPAGRSR